MRSGKMRYRVQLQRPQFEDQRRPGPTDWQDVHVGPPEADGKVWAAIRQQRVASTPRPQKQIAIVGSYEVRIWAVAEIDETWRFIHGQHVYNIVSADQPNLTSKELVLICKRDKLKGTSDAH